MKKLAFLIGVLAAGAAMAQEIGVDDVLGGNRALSATALIVVVVRVLRLLLPSMSDGSLFAKRITALACLLLGVAIGLAGFGPVLEPGGTLGGVLGGIGAGGMAFLGAAIVGPKARLESTE